MEGPQEILTRKESQNIPYHEIEWTWLG